LHRLYRNIIPSGISDLFWAHLLGSLRCLPIMNELSRIDLINFNSRGKSSLFCPAENSGMFEKPARFSSEAQW
jgi:hypothetical protein